MNMAGHFTVAIDMRDTGALLQDGVESVVFRKYQTKRILGGGRFRGAITQRSEKDCRDDYLRR
jgi:hypothetical protein